MRNDNDYDFLDMMQGTRRKNIIRKYDNLIHYIFASILGYCIRYLGWIFIVIGLGIEDTIMRLSRNDKTSKINKVNEINIGIVTVLLVGYTIGSWYVFDKYNLPMNIDRVPLFIELGVFLILGIKFVTLRIRFFKEFNRSNFIDMNNIPPKLVGYRFRKDMIKEYTFKSEIPIDFWYDINFELPTLEIYTPKYNTITIVTALPEIIKELNYKEEIDHKDENTDLDKRIKRVFVLLELNVTHLKSLFNSRFGEVLYFNSPDTLVKFKNCLEEIRHRLKISNLMIETSDIAEYDYLIRVIKRVSKITFIDCYDEVKERLNKYVLPVILGLDDKGEIRIVDYVNRYNTIIGGTIRSGKTNGMKDIISLMLLANKNVFTVFIDPKGDCGMFKGLNNVCYVRDDLEEIVKVLKWLVDEMIRRNNMFADMEFIDNIEKYNNKTNKKMPYLFVVVEELADVLMKRAGANEECIEIINGLLQRLAQRSPSAGIKLFLSTQKPTMDVIGKFIKACCPNRISYSVASKMESLVVLDKTGAELIENAGQFIFKDGNDTSYFKAPLMDDIEAEKTVKMLKELQVEEKVN